MIIYRTHTGFLILGCWLQQQRQRAIFALEYDFLFARWISVFSHHFFHQKILRQAQTLTTHGLEEERAPSGTISCPFLPAPLGFSNCLGSPWSRAGRGTPANRGVSVSFNLIPFFCPVQSTADTETKPKDGAQGGTRGQALPTSFPGYLTKALSTNAGTARTTWVWNKSSCIIVC